jgi:hypothetical protein
MVVFLVRCEVLKENPSHPKNLVGFEHLTKPCFQEYLQTVMAVFCELGVRSLEGNPYLSSGA